MGHPVLWQLQRHIYLRHFSRRFHRLCEKRANKIYPPHLHSVSTLLCEIYIVISETENSDENNVLKKFSQICKAAASSQENIQLESETLPNPNAKIVNIGTFMQK